MRDLDKHEHFDEDEDHDHDHDHGFDAHAVVSGDIGAPDPSGLPAWLDAQPATQGLVMRLGGVDEVLNWCRVQHSLVMAQLAVVDTAGLDCNVNEGNSGAHDLRMTNCVYRLIYDALAKKPSATTEGLLEILQNNGFKDSNDSPLLLVRRAFDERRRAVSGLASVKNEIADLRLQLRSSEKVRKDLTEEALRWHDLFNSEAVLNETCKGQLAREKLYSRATTAVLIIALFVIAFL